MDNNRTFRNRNDFKTPVLNSELGQLPPQDIEYEIYILGNLLQYPDLFPIVANILKPECFYKVAHQLIFQTMMDMNEKDIPIDIHTVTHELRKTEKIDEVGGPYYIVILHSKQFSSTNMEHYCWVVFELFVRRAMIQLFTEETANLYRDNVDILEVYNRVYESLENTFEQFNEKQVKHIKNSVEKAIKEIEHYSSGEEISYLKTGVRLFDESIYLSPKFIVGIAAARGAGKTRFLIYLMSNIFKLNSENVAALWYSMEDSDTKILRLFAAMNTGLTDAQMQSKGGKLTQNQLRMVTDEINTFSKYDIDFVNDQESMVSISRNFNRFMKRHNQKICFLIIDNIMLIDDLYNGKGESQLSIEDRISASLRKIVNNAEKKGYKAIIIFLHHMTKEMESRGNAEEAYRPKLSHMKGSTRFADICNAIILLNLPGMHKDLIKKHSILPDILCKNSDGSKIFVKREILLQNMLLAETAKNRDGEMSDDNKAVQRWIVDFATMKFNELNCLRE